VGSKIGSAVVATPTTSLEYLQLNDGQRVVDPRDLRPVVAAGSPTAVAIDEFEQHANNGKVAFWIGTGVAAAISDKSLRSKLGFSDDPASTSGQLAKREASDE
jgi:hypothetical protein